MLVASLILVVGVGPTYFSPSNVVVIKGIVSVSPEQYFYENMISRFPGTKTGTKTK